MFNVNGFQFRYQPSVIFSAGGEWKLGREPILRRMPDGSLVCLIYSGGPTEPHDDNIVLISRSTDEGKNWSSPEVLFQHDTRGVWATELFTEGERPCIFVHTIDAGSHYLELQTFRSFFNETTGKWSEPVSLPGGLSGCSVRQGLVLRDGSWVFPVYWQEALGGWNWKKTGKEYQQHPEWRFISGVLKSTDNGASFSLHGNIRTADLDMWEPAVVETEPNHLVMLLRASWETAVKYRSDSFDGGLTWSAPQPTDIPCASSKLVLLKWDNRVLMLHNPSNKAGWYQRTDLELWISDDGCRTWPVKINLVHADEPNEVMCYPHAFIDEENQCLHVASDTAKTHYYFTIPLTDLTPADK